MKCQHCGTTVDIRTDKQCPHCATSVLATDAAIVRVRQQISNIWPDWIVTDFLGKGSYGSVYKAVHADNTESLAAIKILRIPADASEADSLRAENMTEEQTNAYFREIADSFADEIRTMQYFKGLQNIISIDDHRIIANEDGPGWSIFIRMELLTAFADYKKNRTLTEEEIIRLGVDICTALSYCEKRNVIHRDVKPENIFLNPYGDFKLGDFGIAKNLQDATSAYTQKGTMTYMAPEVASGLRYDNRADIYSLGIVLYRLLNDDLLPFATSKSFTQKQQANERRMRGETLTAPVHASPALARIVLKACAYRAQDRYNTASDMKKDLLQIANEDDETTMLQDDSTLLNTDSTLLNNTQDQTIVRQDDLTHSNRQQDVTVLKAAKPAAKNEDDPPKKDTKKNILTAALVCIVFVLGIVIGIAVLRNASDHTDNNPTQPATESEQPTVTTAQTTQLPSDTATTAAVQSEATTPSAPASLDKPVDATFFNGHSYYLYDAASFATWEEAKVFCESKGGYLAAISSDVENNYLYSLLGNSDYTEAYFGYNRPNSLQNWGWANGEQSDYNKWHTDELTNPGNLLYARFAKYATAEWKTGDFAPANTSAKAVITSFSASSELAEEIVTHVAERIADGRTESGWVEGADGYGIGESVTVQFDKTYRIDTFTIYAGYHRSEDYFNENAAPSSLTLTFSDGTQQAVSLQKLMQAQTISLHPVYTDSVKITLNGAYAGTKYADTVISEIAFSGSGEKRCIICEWDA
ncbi:MAG: protein kinase [Clostridia bacterium]|nr:protein kinase [Clostridia bacterium]